MRRLIAAAVVAVCLAPAGALGQSAAMEVVQSVGASTESVTSAAVQVRGLADAGRGIRGVVEGSWADRSRDVGDVFGAAYPYGGRVDLIEAYAEWGRHGNRLRAVRAGRYRTPFGLASASDHAYIGFLRPPLIRYATYWALSSGYLEHGVDVLAGVRNVSLEVSASKPSDVGAAIRRDGSTTLTGRAELIAGPAVVGVSRIDTTPYSPVRFAQGRARFTGIDLRAMAGGVQVRGEWLDGQPFTGRSTSGGYLDVIVHTRRMDRVTALARVERLDYEAPTQFALFTHRYLASLRVRAWQGAAVSVGLSHQGGQQTQRRRTALDMGLTWVLRQDRSRSTR